MIPVFKHEIEAGVAGLISNSKSISYCSEIKQFTPTTLQDKEFKSIVLSNMDKAIAEVGDFDLHYLHNILATTGWNKNDDVFEKLELWVARKTPSHKPFNYEHNCADIIGHTISQWALDDDLKVISDTSAIDDLPEKYHIANADVLYKVWDKPELQERMDKILLEISKGEWFVSMEVLFKGFDYSLKSSSGETKIVARNENTAFLSKHLRAYGGSGKYGDYRVGRLLRNLNFSGKGLVRNPANPDSIIFKNTEIFSAKSNFFHDFTEKVYEPIDNDTEKVKERNISMAGELKETVTKDNFSEELKASLQTQADMKVKLDKLESEKENASKALKDAEAAIAASKSETEAVKTKLIEAEKTIAEQKAEIKKLADEKTKAERVSIVQDKLKLDNTEALEYVEANMSLNSEQFTKQVDITVKTIAKNVVVHAPKTEEVSKEKSVESDKAGEKAAASAKLETVEENKEIEINTNDSGVDNVQKSIAEYFSEE